MRGSGDVLDWGGPAPTVVPDTKLGIVALMRELGRPATVAELYSHLKRTRALGILEYHLCTLVKVGIAKILIGSPELRFSLVALNGLDSRSDDISARLSRRD